MAVTPEECMARLREECRNYGDRWVISGYPYDERRALEIAELSIRFGTQLTAVVSVELMLNVARRLDAIEERLNET